MAVTAVAAADSCRGSALRPSSVATSDTSSDFAIASALQGEFVTLERRQSTLRAVEASRISGVAREAVKQSSARSTKSLDPRYDPLSSHSRTSVVSYIRLAADLPPANDDFHRKPVANSGRAFANSGAAR